MMHIINLIAWCIFLLITGLLLKLANGWYHTSFFSTSKTLDVFDVATPITIFILFGVLLASKHLIKQHRIYGEWKLQYSKFILLGILPVMLLLILDMTLNQVKAYTVATFDLYPISILVLIICGYYSTQSLYKERE
ncbi:hypothetical protein [Halalkalibacter alkaliphilus]|uniref:Uncharacterized protein n=1 Tax=Halalkalibacter alkaliphilus TaxID=2917993 RepID=A0A9X2CV27_9BACI|nr:hypothetical protein [Halalkalibacter alkaliphilus]MCL7748409.1 hypothetical protein [Halalkalibacter alkaliphilus]